MPPQSDPARVAATDDGCVGGDGKTPIIDAATGKQVTLPPDLERVLRDPSIRVVPYDDTLDLVRYVYDKVPSNTASAMTVEDWQKAWIHEWQRANRAESEALVFHAEGEIALLRSLLRRHLRRCKNTGSSYSRNIAEGLLRELEDLRRTT